MDRVARWPNRMDDFEEQVVGHRKMKSMSSDEVRAKAAVSKLEDGNVRAAVRILCSNDEPAADSAATLNALMSRHPASPADSLFPEISLDGAFTPLQISEEDVWKTVDSFPPGSSGSLDSL